MGLAIDTVLGAVTNSAALTALTMAGGDSLTVRPSNPSGKATLEAIMVQASTAGQVRVKSPMFADNVSGITVPSKESPAEFLMPQEIGQSLVSQDTLIAQATSGAADSTVVALRNYYSDLAGASARLHSWGDIAGIIRNIKTMEVATVSNAAIGAWEDTIITATEDLLWANTDYAVLGYELSAPLAVVGVKGSELNNFRVCGPGATSTLDISEYFVAFSERMGTPHIPVINSANVGSIFVSTAANTASVACNVYLVLAQLASNLSS